MEDQVKLTDILKAAIQGLNKNLDEIQDDKFRLRWINTKHKIKCCIVSVDELVVTPTNQAVIKELHKIFC